MWSGVRRAAWSPSHQGAEDEMGDCVEKFHFDIITIKNMYLRCQGIKYGLVINATLCCSISDHHACRVWRNDRAEKGQRGR